MVMGKPSLLGPVDYGKPSYTPSIRGTIAIPLAPSDNTLTDYTVSLAGINLAGNILAITLPSAPGAPTTVTIFYKIQSNTVNTITIQGTFGVPIPAQTAYTVLFIVGSGTGPSSSVNLISVSGTSQTPRDWSADLQRLQNLDVLLSTRASEATLTALLNRNTSVLLASMTNTAVIADTDIFAADIVPASLPANVTVHFSANASGILSLKRVIGATTVLETFNTGASLVANAAYEFDIVTNEPINLRYSVNATVLRCLIVQQGS